MLRSHQLMTGPRAMHQKTRASVNGNQMTSSSYLFSLNKAVDATEAMFFLTKLPFLFHDRGFFSTAH